MSYIVMRERWLVDLLCCTEELFKEFTTSNDFVLET